MTRAGLLCAVLLLTGCAGTPHSPTAREVVQQWEAGGGHSAVVPTTLPGDYRPVFPPKDYFGGRGTAGIAVCALPVGQDPVGRCVGTEDDSPWFSTATVDGGLQVVVSTTTGGATERDLDPWRGLTYTSELEGVAWLDEPLDPAQAQSWPSRAASASSRVPA